VPVPILGYNEKQTCINNTEYQVTDARLGNTQAALDKILQRQSLSSCKSALIWSFILIPPKFTSSFQGRVLSYLTAVKLREAIETIVKKGPQAFIRNLTLPCALLILVNATN